MPVEHVNITLPHQLKIALDKEAHRERLGRSTLVQKAIQLYLDLMRRRLLTQKLREGYAEMAGEARLLSKEFSRLDEETLKYVD